MTKKERYDFILNYFNTQLPEVTTELEFGSVFQLLVAVVLSAQCTDKRVNLVTPELFRHIPDAKTMAETEEEELYEYIKSVSYPHSKTRYLIGMSQMIVKDFNGEVPDCLDDLIKLPGVGRKTANVIQAVAFGKQTMAVDTHVYRVSHRLGLVSKNANTPYKVEQELVKNIPSQLVPKAHHWLLLHGRYVCTSLRPKCKECEFDSVCPKLLEGSKL